jgi:hypothetical protein
MHTPGDEGSSCCNWNSRVYHVSTALLWWEEHMYITVHRVCRPIYQRQLLGRYSLGTFPDIWTIIVIIVREYISVQGHAKQAYV